MATFCTPRPQRRRAHRQLAFLGELPYLVERSRHQLFEFLIDLLLAPQELLHVLDPFEVGNGDAAGVAEHVGDDENVAVGQDLIRFRRRGTIRPFRQDPATQPAGVLAGDDPFHRGRYRDGAWRRQHVLGIDRLAPGEIDELLAGGGLAEMLKGGVIMDVTNADQAAIAERAGAVAVMALERVPAQIRAEGGVARMASPKKIREIMATVSIPVMAKCRIGHFAEAQILQELGVDYIDESEVLTPADEAHHVDKHAFSVPFVCGARNLGEALRRIAEGAAMIRTKGEAGTGDVVHAVKHIRQIVQEMKILTVLSDQELYAKAKEHGAPYELIKMVAKEGKLPVPNFSAGGIATPADASLVMQLGAEAVFVGSGIFMKNSTEFADPQEAEKRARAIVKAATHYQDPKVLLEVSEDLAGAMKGLAVAGLDEAHMLQTRGW